MKYSKELILKAANDYVNGKTMPQISALYNINIKALRQRLSKLVNKRKGKEIQHKNDHNYFLANIKQNDNGCIEWTGNCNNKGYGQFSINGKIVFAHRYSYQFYKGNCKGFFVCHSCDNPKCINADHLFLGNYSINNKDKAIKGRSKTNKLTKDQVLQTRSLHNAGMKTAELKTMFKCHKNTIYDILNKKSWEWL